jgi:hypothetical protein
MGWLRATKLEPIRTTSTRSPSSPGQEPLKLWSFGSLQLRGQCPAVQPGWTNGQSRRCSLPGNGYLEVEPLLGDDPPPFLQAKWLCSSTRLAPSGLSHKLRSGYTVTPQLPWPAPYLAAGDWGSCPLQVSTP